MNSPALCYADLVTVLLPWATRHRLHIYTQCRDEEIRTLPVVDDTGDTYHIYAHPDDTGSFVVVGADLVSRAGKHTFFRLRRNFHHQETVKLSALADALDTALERVQTWITKTGHTRR